MLFEGEDYEEPRTVVGRFCIVFSGASLGTTPRGIVAQTSNEAKRNTMSTDQMRLVPTMDVSPIPRSTANHAPPLPSRIAGKPGTSTTCRT